MTLVKPATIKDVAALAGVSAGTVSNVLNRPSYVSEPIRHRVRTAMAKLDYKPRESARQFRPGRVKNIGLVLADMSNPFFMGIALGAESVARESDVGIVILHSAEDSDREDQNLDLLVQQRVQGVLMAQVDEGSEKLVHLASRETPIVFVDRVPLQTDHCSVTVDEYFGGELVGEFLAKQGHRTIAFAGNPHQNSKVASRFAGTVSAAGKHGCKVVAIPVEDWSFESGRHAAQILESSLPNPDRPTAVACATDMVAVGLLQGFAKVGVSVPRDYAIVGYDDTPIAAEATVPLTTVQQPLSLVGATAMRKLLEELEHSHPHEHEHVVLKPRLVRRDSA